MGSLNCRQFNLEENGNLNAHEKEFVNLVINADDQSHQEEYKQKVKAHKNNLENKFRNAIRNIGEFVTVEEMNNKIPPQYLDDLTKRNYDEKYEGDDTNLFEQDPVLFNNGNYYWGSWNENFQQEGSGRLYIEAKTVLIQGFWKEGNLFKGRMYFPEGIIYEGEIQDSNFNGFGKYIDPEGNVYEGEFVNGIKEGNGVFNWKDGTKYWGEFKNDQFDGEGEYCWVNGFSYKGTVKNGLFDGRGFLKAPNGSTYNGSFKDGMYHGKGTFSWPTKLPSGRERRNFDAFSEKYTGEYSDGKKEGQGKYFLPNGDIFMGGWSADKPHGFGEYETNRRIYKCTWRNGKTIEKPTIEIKEFEGDEEFKDEPEKSNLDFIIREEDIDFQQLEHYNIDKFSLNGSKGQLEPKEKIVGSLIS